MPGGESQRFVDGMDIPGQWWTLFQSAELNGLIERALQHNPTLEAAQAALAPGERESGRPARRAAIRASRAPTRRSAPGVRRRNLVCRSKARRFLLHVEQRFGERVLHARCLRRHPPPDRGRCRRRPTMRDSRSRRATSPSPPMWSPRRSPRLRCGLRSPPPRTSRARSRRSSTSRSGGSPPAALRAPTFCSSRQPCKRLSRACRRCAPQLAQQRNLLADLRGRTARRLRGCGSFISIR